MNILRGMRAVVFACLGGILSLGAQAQFPRIRPGALQAASQAAEGSAAVKNSVANLPDAPGQQQPEQKPGGSIGGIVMDPSGAVVPGALVTLQVKSSDTQHTAVTGNDGTFSFDSLNPGLFTVTIRSRGFAPWTSTDIVLSSGEVDQLPKIGLRVGMATDVEVFSSQTALAEEQIHLQEKQRVLGIIPNFYTSYIWNAAPLTTKQKFGLAFRSEIDPVSFLGAAVGAGYEQSQNDYRDYGQGAQGFAKRFGASYVDGFDGAMIGGAILPSIFHQDPRYYWKGTGTTRQRALYAISTVVRCKGDNGQWQTNYSNIIGNFAAGGISNIYYPPASRGAQLTIDNALLGFAAEAIGDLFQEFLLRKISTGAHP